ncbi:hypothetical protein ACFV1N_20680 [Streptosporangium canum]|uniref:hypothetical protein n=1 Tax=Streptosporangium canum TaxID=324952 RepID=UPI0036BE6483
MAHVRVYEHPPDPARSTTAPVVIIGQFSDHSGRWVDQSVEHVAAAIQAAFYPHGRHFTYLEHRAGDALRGVIDFPVFRPVIFHL